MAAGWHNTALPCDKSHQRLSFPLTARARLLECEICRPGSFAVCPPLGSLPRAQCPAHSSCSASVGRINQTSERGPWGCPCPRWGQRWLFLLPHWLFFHPVLSISPLPLLLSSSLPSLSSFLYLSKEGSDLCWALEPGECGSSPCSATSQL